MEPGGPQASGGDADCKYLSKTKWEGKAFSQRRRPHDSCCLSMVVEEADNWEESTGERSREEMSEDKEKDGGEPSEHPNHPDVEVGRVSAPLTALHWLEVFTSVHCPALLREHPHRVEAPVQQAGSQLGVKIESLEGVDGERELREVVPVQLLHTLAHRVSSHQHLCQSSEEVM